jgi:hypothetical protein
MRLLFLLIIGILAILPLYPEDTDEDDSGENDAIEQPESDTPRGYRREGGHWATLFSGNIGYSDQKDNNFIAGLDIAKTYVPYDYGGMLFNIHTLGLDYQHLVIDDNSQSIIRMGYTYARYALGIGAGVGISGFYNIDNNNIGIAPKIGVSGLIPYGFFNRFFLMLNFYYRYNFVLNNVKNSYYEFVYSVSINMSLNRDD